MLQSGNLTFKKVQKRFCSFEKVKTQANVQNRMSRARSHANFHTRYGGTKKTIKPKCLDCLVLSYWSSFHVIILICTLTHTHQTHPTICAWAVECVAHHVSHCYVSNEHRLAHMALPPRTYTHAHTERWPSLLHSSLRVSQLNGSSWFKAQNFKRLKVLVWDLKVSCRFTTSAAVRGGADMERGGASVMLPVLGIRTRVVQDFLLNVHQSI